jgi:hypothetical protein
MKTAADPATLFRKGGAPMKPCVPKPAGPPHGRAAWFERADAIDHYDRHSEAAGAALAEADVLYPDAPAALALPFREGQALRNGALARSGVFIGSCMGSPAALAAEAGAKRSRDR